MAAVPVKFNGTMAGWANLVVNILGIPLEGITSFECDEAQANTFNHGAGNYAYGFSYGQIDGKGSFTVFLEEYNALKNASPNKRIQELPFFDVPVAFLPKVAAPLDVPSVETVKNIKFLNTPISVKQGDTKVEVKLDFIFTHIER